jgi:hypothetical protein
MFVQQQIHIQQQKNCWTYHFLGCMSYQKERRQLVLPEVSCLSNIFQYCLLVERLHFQWYTFLKPNCYGISISLFWKWLNLLYITFSSTLENAVNSANWSTIWHTNFVTFLYCGPTTEILRWSGKIPVNSEWLQKWVNVRLNRDAKTYKIYSLFHHIPTNLLLWGRVLWHGWRNRRRGLRELCGIARWRHIPPLLPPVHSTE